VGEQSIELSGVRAGLVYVSKVALEVFGKSLLATLIWKLPEGGF
jgi:hypothetical protein